MNIDPVLAGILGGLVSMASSLGIQSLKNSGRLGAIRAHGDVRISSMERSTINKLLNDLAEERKAWQKEKEELLAEREAWRSEKLSWQAEKLELQFQIADLQAAIEGYANERARYSRDENKLRDKVQEFAIALAARELRIQELEARVLSVENGKPKKGDQ